MTAAVTASLDTIHRFERAGLGKAPFRYLGSEYRVGPIITQLADGTEVHVGAPGQPMGSCDYCGQGIAECCVILSSDGKRFIVGNECVYKTGDKGLVKAARDAHNASARARKAERDGKRIAAAREALNRQEVRDALASEPHPRGFTNRETGEPLTALDWAVWMMAHAGTAGRLDAAKTVERVQVNGEVRS